MSLPSAQKKEKRNGAGIVFSCALCCALIFPLLTAGIPLPSDPYPSLPGTAAVAEKPSSVSSPSPQPGGNGTSPEGEDYTVAADAKPPLESEAPEGMPTDTAEPADPFSHAVFIGDSLTDGLRLFSGISRDATFLFHTGLTVDEVLEGKKVIGKEDNKRAVLDILKGLDCDKIYILLGVNEIGYDTVDNLLASYRKLIEKVKVQHGDARITVQAVMPVNTGKCRASGQPSNITNEKICRFNLALSELAAQEEVHFFSVPEGLTDEEGEVLPEYSSDGIHFKKDGYILWLEALTRDLSEESGESADET